MQFVKDRFNYLFNSTKGLILVAIAMVGIVTAIWGMLSGPMAEMGVREVVIKLFGMKIVQAEREGRIIILYHSIAMAIVAIETYMVTSLLKMKALLQDRHQRHHHRWLHPDHGLRHGLCLLRSQLGISWSLYLRLVADLLRGCAVGHCSLALESGILRHR